MKLMEEYMRDILKGEVETIDATQLKKHLGECLTQASLGKSFCIRRKGQIVAFLVSSESVDVVHTVMPDGTASTL